jgi:hypothetical protein
VADEPEVFLDERLDVRCRNGHPDCFGPRSQRLSPEDGVRGPRSGGFTPLAHPLTRTCSVPIPASALRPSPAVHRRRAQVPRADAEE